MFHDTNLIFTTLWPTVLWAVSVVLVVVEYLIKCRRFIFTIVSVLFMAGASTVLLVCGCSLCDLLLLVCSTLALRLFFEIREGRKKE